MPLTDTAIRALKPRDKAYKVTDAKGLYLHVTPAGGKLWRIKYRLSGKEKLISVGPYPEVSLTDAREARDAARQLIVRGEDPAAKKRRDKALAGEHAAQSFDAVAREYIAKMEREARVTPKTIAKTQWLLSLLSPTVGREPVSQVEPQLLLAALKKIERRGRYETARRARSFASRVFRYAVATARANSDPAAVLIGALDAPKAKNYAAILDPVKLGELLRAICGFTGSPVTQLALMIAPHVFVRPGELRHADWAEIDLDEAVWRIPVSRMKARRPHAVPLSPQVIALFRELHEMTGPAGFVFPSIRTASRPMSENTLNAAFRRLGYGSDEITAHGLRATASTLLNESGKWNPDAIERALAHGHSDAVRGAYHRGEHWPERIKMALWWSNYLDSLRDGGAVVPLRQRASV